MYRARDSDNDKYVLLLFLSHKTRWCQQLETGEYVVSGSENVSAIDFFRILEHSVISPQNFGEKSGFSKGFCLGGG